MLETVVKNVSIVINAIGTVVKIVEMLHTLKEKHQKSNRPQPKE